METGLRIVLLLVAVIIIAGIVWDTFRSRRKPSIKKAKKVNLDRLSKKKTEHFEINAPHSEDNENPQMDLLIDDVVLVKPKTSQKSSKNSVKDKSHSQSILQSSEKWDDFQEDVRLVSKPEETQTPSFFILNVMAKQPGSFLGKKLIEVFDELHLYYGEMQIFHRYENNDGSGKPMFSLASAIEPGVFDLATLESYITPGLTLFFSPTTRNHSIAAFELMLRTAKMLASALDGEMRDQSRKPLTLEGIEKYRKDVRESVKLHRASSALFNANV
jgi:cell division protein ZipA